MKHNLLKSLIISVILLTGVSNAWAEKGFFGEGQWNIQYWDGHSDNWGSNASGYDDASSLDLGIQTKLWLINGWVNTWSNNNWTQSEVIWYWGWTSGSTTNNYKAYKSSLEGDLNWNFDTDYDLIGNAPNNPGHNTLYMYWRLDDYVSSSTSTVTFTIPGFTSTNTSKTFSNTTVGSNRSQTISFGTHYGTALTTSNCTITGTNKSEFSVTSISESGVTVNFAPKTAGNKSATLTIKDAHGNTCTITLNGKTQHSVTYSKGNNGTGNSQTDYKVYGTNLTLKDKGLFTRIGYKQIAWNTNPDGTSGITYALGATYTKEEALMLYPTWEAQPATTIYLEPTGYWNSHNPQYVAHVWKNSVNEDIIMEGVGDSPYRYYKAEVPYGYTDVVFYRKRTDGTIIWNQTADLKLPTNDNVLYTITSTETNNPEQQDYQPAEGYWKVANLVYTVTLEATSYGSFQVTCNGETKTEGEIFENVAAGTQLTITNIQPKTEGYDQTMVYSLDDGANYTYFSDSTEIDGNRTYTYTVNSDVTIAEDFRTTDSRVVYIKVTYKPYWHWCTINNEKDVYPRIIYYNGVNQNRLHNEANLVPFDELLAETNQYNIYGVKIPKGYNSFKLYPGNSFSEYGGPEEVFSYQIIPEDPLKNCFEFKNDENNTGPKPDGEWVSGSVNLKKVADSYDSGYGHFTVEYNNTKYTSKSNEDVTFKTPIGSTITIVESQHEHPETYNGDLKYTYGGSEHYLNNPVNYPITVWGDIEITENFVVRKEATDRDITPNAGVFVFLRIPKRLDQRNVEGDWNYGQPEDQTRHDGYPIDKFANFVYLKMDVKRGHEVIGSKPEDLGCADAGQEAGHFLMDTAHIQDDQFNTYYCIITDSCWHTVKFERKHADSDAGQGQITCTDIQRFPGGKNNCFTITERKSDGAFIGTWGEAPTCTVTLGYCEFGRYGVVYDGKTYYSKDRSDVVIENVPLGTELQILPGEPASDKYNGNLTYEITENDKKVKRDLTTSTYTVTQDVTIDDNFVTNRDITAYLGIPTALTDWTKNGNQNIDNHSMQELAVYIWKTDSYDKGFSMEETERGSYSCTIDGIAYYKFTITAGCNDFQFQLKDLKNAEEGNNGKNSGYTYRKSQWHRFQIPLTDVNCFVLDVNNYGSDNSKEYTGYWTRLPQQEKGDYRLRYIEQTLTLVDGHPHTEEVYSHCSDVIKANDPEEKRTLYSLHIFNEMDEEKTYGGEIIQGLNNPAIVVEKWDGSQWVEQMRHMVFGPLRGDFSLAAMPGRRNESPIDPYDNGIENIKNDLKNIEAYSNSGTSFYIGKDNPEETDYKRYIENWGNDNCSGVWNFVVNRDDAGNINTQDPLLLEKTHRYDGTYYIRTIGTIGGWDNYTIPENHMTRTNISKTNSNFSHYFCKWLTKNVNVRYVIANDYNLAISDDLKADKTTLMGKPIGDNDKIVADDEELPTNVNVRFSWNEKTNFLHRAYLSGSTHVQDRFLVLGGSGDGKLFDKNGNDLKAGEDTGSDPRYGLNANEEIFQDISNWIYYTDVQMKPLAEVKLTALIKDEQDKRIEQYFVGTSDEWNNTLLQGTSDEKYLIRVLYDFKTNQMISAYVPDRKETEDIGHIKTNLMLIREENNTETIHQLTFNTNHMEEIDQQAYGVLEFTHKTLREGSYNELSRRLYWISFPFDVRIEDAFGSLKYGTHWIIQTYNGKKRADNGLYYESESNWINNFNPNDVYNYDATEEEDKSRGILRNGAGYVVALNLKNIRRDFDLTTDSRMAIYFPSKEFIKKEIVKKGSVTIDVPAHACTKPGRDIYDSHWNVIGVPSYKSAGANFNHPILAKNDVKYYYSWLGEHDKYEPVSQSEVNFNTLFSYMVQYGGELYWENIVQEDWSTNNIAARKDVDNQKEYNLRLELQQNGNQSDRTYFTLQEDDVTALFDFNYDLCKITNAGANIYSFTSDATPIKVAGNVQPLAEDIVIPVGVVIAEAGDYTFSMPDGTAGIEVQLIDYQTNEKTNLLFGDYTINLPKGTFDNRFALLINPDKTATSVDNIGAEAEGVKKYIIDGQLYLQQGSALYDAQGHTVR